MLSNVKIWLAVCLLVLAAGACRTNHVSAPLVRFDFQRPAMGTLFRISLYAETQGEARAAADAAFERIDQLEDVLSDYQADSELSLLREQPVGVPVAVSDDLFQILRYSQAFHRKSNGAFDITAGSYTRLWRFSRKRRTLPSAPELAQAAQSFGMDRVRLDPHRRTVTLLAPGMRLDAGGIAKGYSADQALAVLKAAGFQRALVAASGDIVAGDPPPGEQGWSVAVEGMDRQGVTAKVLLRNSAVSTSGDTEQFIEIGGVRYSHILDPRTGLGLTNRIQATVLAPSATTSDALATAVCILGARNGMRMVKSERSAGVLIITQCSGGSSVFRSRNFDRSLTR